MPFLPHRQRPRSNNETMLETASGPQRLTVCLRIVNRSRCPLLIGASRLGQQPIGIANRPAAPSAVEGLSFRGHSAMVRAATAASPRGSSVAHRIIGDGHAAI